jgi:hypothetical protein
MNVVYKITYPNGKIYIGKELTDSNKTNCIHNLFTSSGGFAKEV